MRVFLRSLLPSRISGQIAIIIVVSLIIIHSILTFGIMLDRREPDGPPGPSHELGPLIQLIDRTEPQARSRLVSDIARAYPKLAIALSAWPPADAGRDGLDPRLDRLADFLGPGFRVAAPDPDAPPGNPAGDRVAIRLSDGQGVTLRLAPRPPPPLIGSPVTATLTSIAVIMTLLGLWAARALTAPLRAFVVAAEGFSPDAEMAPLPEGGPYEIRAAATALNRMRARIKRLIDDRTRMLAAVGHDLRTPITRLRLRSEYIEDTPLRSQMLDDLEQMNAMVESVLIFLREGRSQEEAAMIDVATSLQTICDQFADTGSDVAYQGPDRFAIRAHAVALDRAVTNLIDNAVRYGGRAEVRLTVERGSVVIAVADDGPGIPDDQKDAMLEPFVRGDAARTMEGQTGFGLGLSIARAVAVAHGGTLVLRDRQPTGLIARIELPAEAAPPASDAAAAQGAPRHHERVD